MSRTTDINDTDARESSRDWQPTAGPLFYLIDQEHAMAKRYIAPLGFIRQTTDDGAIFTLAEARDSENLGNNTTVTVWRYSPEQLALAKIRGLITAVGYVTATFRTVESKIDVRWPEEEQILRERTPVYLAIEDTFEPNPRRMLTQQQADRMRNFGQDYRRLRSGNPQGNAQGHVTDEEE